MSEVVLWDYPKSSASYRVRIALNLAGVEFRIETVNLLEKAHRSDAHLARNPQGFVPVLDIDGHRLTQSLAIVEYLDATRGCGFLPNDTAERARVQALAYSIAVDVHPVCNLSVATHATGNDQDAKVAWMKHFITPGLAAFEALLAGFAPAPFVGGAAPGLAEICLIPQLYNANRWGADYAACAGIRALEAACADLPAFQKAHPDA